MRIFSILIGLFGAPAFVMATEPVPAAIQAAVRSHLQSQPALSSGKFELEFGAWQSKFANCELPLDVWVTQPRLRGKISVRVRCVRPAWLATALVKIGLPGDYWVAERFLPAGSVLASGDLRQVSGDLASLPDDVIRSESQALGRVVVRSVNAGAVLGLNGLRENAVIKSGERVRVLLQGSGFSVTGEGTAMANAASGETVTLRMRDGQQLQGRVLKPGVVEVSLE